ncbi:ATP-binding cassette long-chain fatty acid transporter pxa2 [Saitoella coloradoensis]
MAVLSKDISATLRTLSDVYLRHRPKIGRAFIFALVCILVARVRRTILLLRKTSTTTPDLTKKKGKQRVELNATFLHQFRSLLHICIPSPLSPPSLLLLTHSTFLLLRTLLSLRVASLDGQLVSSLVRARPRTFLWRLGEWMLIAVPATYVNAMLGYLQGRLGMEYRGRLTRRVLGEYLKDNMFYRIGNLDERIQNPDQLLTVDIARFSSSLAALWGNLAKPMVDILIYSIQLGNAVGGEALFAMGLFVIGSSRLLRGLTPPFGRFAAEEARLEGEFRGVHANVIECAEEIALYRGHEPEKTTLDTSYFSLIRHINRTLRRRLWFNTAEDFILKYVFGAAGLLLCAVPVFAGGAELGKATEEFIRNRRLLLAGSDSFGRIMYSYKEISELAGYTSRVSSLFDTMSDIEAGKLQKTLIATNRAEAERVLASRGTIVESPNSEIQFDNVPIVSPNGDVLVKSLTFWVKKTGHLLVVGPNGSGKSSLFRILGSLWPVYGGVVRKPPAKDIFYIPQRPYLSIGTLRDQVIYPHTKRDMLKKGVTDEMLFDILKVMKISGIVAREGGWDAEREWRDALSGGDKQRIAAARLFYHAPQYAILDECTSALSLEMEEIMYTHATSLGITLMTVSHRPSLWKYHEYILQYDGQGGYIFTELDAEQRLRLEEEKGRLDVLLARVPEMEERLRELKEAKGQGAHGSSDGEEKEEGKDNALYVPVEGEVETQEE